MCRNQLYYKIAHYAPILPKMIKKGSAGTHLAISSVILSAAKKRPPQAVACKEEILRCAQNDNRGQNDNRVGRRRASSIRWSATILMIWWICT